MIKKIVHISDIHIRTNQLHDLYKRQFELFFNDLQKKLYTDVDNKFQVCDYRIVITGDLFHQKINISNELIMLVSWFIDKLTDLGHVVIIPGNHDFLVNNTERLDSITPIVELLNKPDKIYYYNESGVYKDDGINWVVYSLYQNNQRPKFEKEVGVYYVGLFHGPIQGLSTDLGYKFDDGYDTLNFVDLDLLLCGDIHKRQKFKLPGGGDAIMIGSFIQQDFGETVNHHGYGIFDMETKEYTFHDLPNEQPFLHFKLNDIKDIETESERLINLG
jgi:DNA repair exonuclease SbcCD nuclease subunit